MKAFVVEEPKRKEKLEIQNEPLIIERADLGVMIMRKVTFEITGEHTERCKVTVYMLGAK
nr:hypothetical protein [Candidatus Njordarchaeota archaeon]